MKSFSKKPNPEIEQDEEDVEIDEAGPKIAAGKKSKLAIVVASAVLITAVIYVLFFKSEPPKDEKLQEVQIVPDKVNVMPSDDGKSPFEIEQAPEKPKNQEAAVFDQPATPKVPELPKDAVATDAVPVTAPVPVDPAKAMEQAQQQLATPPGIPPVVQPQNVVPGGVPAQNPTTVATPAPVVEEVDPRYAPIVVLSGSAGPASSIGYDNNIVNLKVNPLDALQKSESTVEASYIEDRSHTIAQGKLITAVMESSINTEIPGFVRAIVSRDVYGESGNNVLIPKGSRLFGAYSSQIVRGQGRVNIGWTRLIRPDGVTLAISFNASDQFGRSGISGEVDNRYGSVIANSLLTSVLAVGGAIAAQKLSGNSGTAATTTTNPTLGTVTSTGGASNQIIYDVTKTIMDTVGQMAANTLNTTPVIRVPQGTRINVVVNADIKVPYVK